jgi:anti-sigma factor RsiW
MRLYHHDDPQHVQASELLPWFVNGTLDPHEHARVEHHLADCIACKQELVRLRAWQQQYRGEGEDAGASHGLARVSARIDEIESGIAAQRRWPRMAASWNSAAPWLRVVVLAQIALLTGLITVLLLKPISHPAPAAWSAPARVLAVFHPIKPEHEIRALLLSTGARIVDGPTPEGAYTLEVNGSKQLEVLEQLRAHGAVQRAEPIYVR